MTETRAIFWAAWAVLALACCLLTGSAAAQELRLAAPPEMAESGFLKHILPRFKLKHRIAVTPVAPGEAADMALVPDGAEGTRVFAAVDGPEYRLVLQGGAGAVTFRDWLLSTPGKSAVTSFPRGGPPAFTADLAEVAVAVEIELTGDAVLGSKLALQHCGRCHVVDTRNRMGGIGSTPSFGAMRARPHWIDLFSKYWSENPHPSFTEVVGVTEPFGPGHVTHIAPVQITLEDIDAIVAFVGTLEPKNLGRPVQSN
ncbi:MAG: hypothetical protein QNJ16_17395 [Rhodobacter sp.]|nr:hypothetical protein [Rhodobacter sp.]